MADILPDGLAGVVVTEGYAKGQIVEYVGSSYLENSCVKGGAGGLSFIGSSVMGPEDMIDLRVSYRVKPFASLMGFDGFFLSQRYYGRAWTGYDLTGTAGRRHAGRPYGLYHKNGDSLSFGEELRLFKSEDRDGARTVRG